jgi:hypothetical protein|nr:MAG TPA: hypothetical protein [Caudoviricetes sp.]
MKYRVKGTNITIARYDYDEHNVNIILVSPKHLLIRNYENLTSKQRVYYNSMVYMGNKVPFSLDDLEPYEEVLISHNAKVCIVYVLSIILIISAFMWAMDLCYNVNLFLPLFVTILFTLIVIIATCLALCELEL